MREFSREKLREKEEDGEKSDWIESEEGVEGEKFGERMRERKWEVRVEVWESKGSREEPQ